MTEKKEQKKILAREDFFNRAPLLQEVKIPEYDGWIFVKILNGPERRYFYTQCTDAEKDDKGVPKNIMPVLIQLCACFDDGSLIFNEEDVRGIDNLPLPIQEIIFSAAAEFNGFTVKGIEARVKN